MSDLAELLERVEKATGPDRKLDCELQAALVHRGEFVTVGPPTYDPERYFCNPPPLIEWIGYDLLNTSPAYTASIDAAIALVERLFGIDAESMLYNYDLGWHASAWAEMAFTADLHLAVGTPPEMQEFHAQALTLPLAILAALLRALIAQQAKP